MSETRATWHKITKKSHKEEEDVVAMSADVKEHVEERCEDGDHHGGKET